MAEIGKLELELKVGEIVVGTIEIPLEAKIVFGGDPQTAGFEISVDVAEAIRSVGRALAGDLGTALELEAEDLDELEIAAQDLEEAASKLEGKPAD